MTVVFHCWSEDYYTSLQDLPLLYYNSAVLKSVVYHPPEKEVGLL